MESKHRLDRWQATYGRQVVNEQKFLKRKYCNLKINPKKKKLEIEQHERYLCHSKTSW